MREPTPGPGRTPPGSLRGANRGRPAGPAPPCPGLEGGSLCWRRGTLLTGASLATRRRERTPMPAFMQPAGLAVPGVTHPLQSCALRQDQVCIQLDVRPPSSNRPGAKDKRVSFGTPPLPPPHPEPLLEFARHPKSSTRAPASPEGRAAAALLLNSKANPSLNSYNNKHRPIWAGAGRGRRLAQLVGGPLIVKKKKKQQKKPRSSGGLERHTQSSHLQTLPESPGGSRRKAPARGRIPRSQVMSV